VRFFQLKLILLVRSIPESDQLLRDLLSKFGLLERFTPYIAGGRGAVRGEEAREAMTSAVGISTSPQH
jgi:hypothetical protein